MTTVTLKSLYNYLRVLENASELKRRLPAASNPRTLKEGLYEMSSQIEVGSRSGRFNPSQLLIHLIELF
jgi:hypothetical protein